MNLSFCIYRRHGGNAPESWTLVGAHGHQLTRTGHSQVKLEHKFREALRKLLKATPAHEVRSLERAPGIRLEHVRMQLSLRGDGGRRAVSGRFPLVVEPRHAGEGCMLSLVYHPERKDEWFALSDDEELSAQASRFFQDAWSELDSEELRELLTHGREQLHISISGAAKPPKLQQKSATSKVGLDEERPKVLAALAVDRTAALELTRDAELGFSREPYRGELSRYLSGQKKRSVLVVGESGSGKNTLIDQAVRDLLLADDYPSHRNLDRVHHVYQLSGRQLIAGMSYLGEWEQRCFDLFEEAKKERAILWITDLAVFGRTGRSRQSDRSLADVFRAPIARGELTVIADLTPAELARLEQDAPDLVALFAPLRLPPASREDALRMLLCEARRIERERPKTFLPDALISVLELASTLVSDRVLPGAALDWLTRMAGDEERALIQAGEVLEFVAGHTGLRRVLFDRKEPLDAETVRAELAARVLGQSGAVARVVELVLRVKAGLTDPRRP